MNLIAIDIGNTNIKVAFYLKDEEVFLNKVNNAEGDIETAVTEILTECWDRAPLVERAKEPTKECIFAASSVRPDWTEMVQDILKEEFGQKLMIVGVDIPLPIETAVDDALAVGTDRLITAAAAFSVVEDAVIVADFGTAVTIDLVDSEGTFVGGLIAPGFDLSLKAMHTGTAKLPAVTMQKPKEVYGANTEEAMRAGVYWAAVGLLETTCRKYAEQIGHWPQVILTGGAAAMIKEDCDFVDSWVADLAVRGIMVAYKKYLFEKADIAELDQEDQEQ